MENLFAQFLREKQFLQMASPKTIQFYKDSWSAYKRFCEGINKEELKNFVIRMVESGMKPVTVNVYGRGINSFLKWLYENEHLTEPLKVQAVKEEKKVIQT